MSRVALPYFIVSEDAIAGVQFTLLTAEGEIPLPDHLSDWDYNTNLVIRARAEIDWAVLKESAHLDDSDLIKWSFGWRTIDGNITGAGQLRHGKLDGPTMFEMTLPGNQVGDIVELALRAVFAGSRVPQQPGKVSLPGSILWEKRQRLAVAGEGARFPIQILDFAGSNLDRDASWCVDVGPDLETPVLGGLVLLVNSADKALVEAMSDQAAIQPPLVTALTEGAFTQLLDTAIARHVEITEGAWPDDSMGAMLAALLVRLGDDLAAMIDDRVHRPAQYQAKLVGEARRQEMGRSLR